MVTKSALTLVIIAYVDCKQKTLEPRHYLKQEKYCANHKLANDASVW